MARQRVRPAYEEPPSPLLALNRGHPRSSYFRRRGLIRNLLRNWRFWLGLALVSLVEVLLHIRSFDIARPATNLDPPFYVGCQEPVLNGSARASAALVVLARNSDVADAVQSVKNVQEQFNRHFGYPWVFFNDKPWSNEFVTRVTKAVEADGGGATARFETISEDMWGYPDWIDQDRARKNMAAMENRGISYAGKESYHHMCRFNSG